jgi:hypothetical protein
MKNLKRLNGMEMSVVYLDGMETGEHSSSLRVTIQSPGIRIFLDAISVMLLG